MRRYVSRLFAAAIICTICMSAPPAALTQSASPSTNLSAEYLVFKSDLARSAGNDAEAIETFTHLIQKYPDYLSRYAPGHIAELVDASWALSDRTTYRKLVEALKAAHYAPNSYFHFQDHWFRLMEIYATDGDTAKAAAIAHEITSAYLLVALKIDKRYAGLRPLSDADIKIAFDAELERHRQAVADHPQNLEPYAQLAEALGDHNRAAEGLAIIDAALSRIEAAPKDMPPFEDLQTSYSWALDNRASLLAQLGRYDEAESAYINADKIAQQSNGDPVSHRYNLAGFYNRRQRPNDALKAIESLASKSSSYGKMMEARVRVCAYTQLGDTGKVKQTLAEMLTSENVSQAYGSVETALLCAGREGQLAYLIILRLENPEVRNEALLGLQTYMSQPSDTPVGQAMEALWKQTLAREDVQATLRKYGDITSVPIVGKVY